MTSTNQNLNLKNIAQQLESENSRDRLRALVSLRDLSPEDAVPLILKVIDDDNLQIRSMAI
ncbi:MAG: HEAT repeat domain-containing protein, partial [Pseudanabaena sp.]